MNNSFNGKRLREARYYNSLSITQLADKLSISKQMVSKYENGRSSPSLENLFKIMKTLGFPREFFYDEYSVPLGSSGIFYRSLLTSTQKQKAPSNTLMEATSIYRDFLSNYIEFPQEDSIDLSTCSPEIAAQKLRKYWGLGDQPIDNMINLMESHGLTIIFLPDKMQKVDAFGSYRIVDNRKYYIIAVRKNASFFKEQFSLAHELAHKILHANVWNPADLDNYEYRLMEKQANEFASAFLLPINSFTKSVETVNSLDVIFEKKKFWFTSGAAIIQRMKQLSLITEDQYIKYQKQISYRKYRKKEPYDNDSNYPVQCPTLLSQATKLIVNNNIMRSYEISDEIQNRYKVKYPSKILEEITLLPHDYFDFIERSAPININLKNKNV